MPMGESPRMIPIYYNGAPYTDQVKAFRVSKDGALAACVLKNNDILIYRVCFKVIIPFSYWIKKEILFLRRTLKNL